MSSVTIEYIDSVIDDVQLLVKARSSRKHIEKFKVLRFMLRNLKTFVLAAECFGNDEDLESCLIDVKVAVRINSEAIHHHCLGLSSTSTTTYQQVDSATKFREDIQCLEGGVGECYMIMLEDELQQSGCVTPKGVLDTIGSVLDNLVDFQSLRSRILPVEIVESVGALEEPLKFLRGLVCLAMDPGEDLLAHTQAVAVNAAHLIFTCRADTFDEESRRVMQSKISNLEELVKPIDHLIYELYTEALHSSKLLRPCQDFIGITDFLDPFISNLWEMLRLNSYGMSTRDQLQELYEKVRVLMTILKQQPNSLEHMKEMIGVVVCDTGLLICSWYRAEDVDYQLLLLLEAVKNIVAQAGDGGPIFNASRTNALVLVDALLEKLMKLQPSCDEAQTMQQDLDFVRGFLVEIVELSSGQEELKNLWSRVLDAVCCAEILIDQLVVGGLPGSLSASFDSLADNINGIKADVLRIQVNKVPRRYTQAPLQTSPSTAREIVGLDDDATMLVDKLLLGSERMRVVAIVGMPGLGKTTLATRVYNDYKIVHHFHVRAWCPISQELDKSAVLEKLLTQVDPNESYGLTEQDLIETLWRRLKGKRYLIFLDDVWDIQAWNRLEFSFPDDGLGSRIIMTSRQHDSIPHEMLEPGTLPHSLHLLSVENSLELLRRKLFPREKSWPVEVKDIAREIAQHCKGLPLTIVIVAGLLATTDQNGWRGISESMESNISIEPDAEHSLELSFNHLPDHLRPCLLYLGVFPEDEEVAVRRLLHIWIAEGIVRQTTAMSLEDVAEGYLEALLGRSLIIVSKQRFDGGVKAFRIHDLLRDFCLKKSKSEHFFNFLDGNKYLEFGVQRNLWRLCIDSELEGFKQSKLSCPRARSLLFNPSQKAQTIDGVEMLLDLSIVIHFFKSLKVLDLEKIDIGSVFPSEIALLLKLAFLAIRGRLKVIPPSIGQLSYLETLIVDSGENSVSLPNTLWDLQKLQYVCFRSSHNFGGGILPTENIDSPHVLSELDRFSGAFIPSWKSMERLLKKFPNVRKLKCKLFQGRERNVDRIVIPGELSKLESLHMSRQSGFNTRGKLEFSLPENLKKLTLTGFQLHGTDMSTIGGLPNLQVLKLLRVTFEGDTWEIEEGEFTKLRWLTLSHVNLTTWVDGYDQLEAFEKLVLDNCRHLEEIPSLGDLATLKGIEVYHCSEAVVGLVREVEQNCQSWGYEDVKFLIHS